MKTYIMPRIKIHEVQHRACILAESDNSVGVYNKPTNGALSKQSNTSFFEDEIYEDTQE